MTLPLFHNAGLAAVSAVVPGRAVNLEDELEYYGGSLEKAKRLSAVSGLSTRRIAPKGVTASDMCVQAAENLFETYSVDKNEIGALLFVSHSPDYLLPASAAIQRNILDLPASCATMDMNVGCAGFIKGFWMASSLVQSGACAKVLLLVGDTPNRFLDPANRVTSPVFGDAGTAALIERRKNGPVMSFLLGSNGSGHEALVIPGGGSRIPQKAEENENSPFNRKITDAKGNPWTLGGYCRIWMDGMAIYTFGVSVVPKHIKKHLEAAGTSADELDALLLHQANKVIIEGVAKKTGFPLSKVPYETLPKYGNLGSSSIPALICEHYGTGKGGENGMKPHRAKGRVMLCGFGAGLTWGSCLLSLEDTVVSPVREYVMPERVPSREERIAYWHRKFAGKQE